MLSSLTFNQPISNISKAPLNQDVIINSRNFKSVELISLIEIFFLNEKQERQILPPLTFTLQITGNQALEPALLQGPQVCFPTRLRDKLYSQNSQAHLLSFASPLSFEATLLCITVHLSTSQSTMYHSCDDVPTRLVTAERFLPANDASTVQQCPLALFVVS